MLLCCLQCVFGLVSLSSSQAPRSYSILTKWSPVDHIFDFPCMSFNLTFLRLNFIVRNGKTWDIVSSALHKLFCRTLSVSFSLVRLSSVVNYVKSIHNYRCRCFCFSIWNIQAKLHSKSIIFSSSLCRPLSLRLCPLLLSFMVYYTWPFSQTTWFFLCAVCVCCGPLPLSMFI